MHITKSLNSFIPHLVKYRSLIYELVIRDLKVKYRRSFLGYLWSLLNPLMMMAVMATVFKHVIRANVDNYPLYLICGQTLFSFFTESTSMAMHSVLVNATLIKKIYVPKFIFPISRVTSSFVTMSFSLTAILIVMLVTRARFYWTMLLIPVPILFLFLFCCGMGMMLSALSVYFRDVTHLWSVVTLAWMYGTPIFYNIDMMPERLMRLMKLNPMYHFLNVFRNLVIWGNIPGVNAWFGCVASGLLVFALGIWVFGKLQKNFILYI